MPAYKYQTNDGKTKWYCSFHYVDWTGKNRRKKKKGFSTKREALEWERSFLDTGTSDPDIRFSSLVKNYLADMQDRLKQSTLDSKEYMIRTKLLPYFGDMKISEIDAIRIRKWQTEMASLTHGPNQRRYSATYLRSMHAQLSSILNYAVRFYGLKRNPCAVAGSMGSSQAEEMTIWTREQFEQAMQHVKRRSYHAAFDTLFYTGIREGELLALTPADIPEDTPVIHINKDYYVAADGTELFQTTKTPWSTRDVLIHEDLHKELLAYIHGMQIGPDERIFYFKKHGLLYDIHRASDKAGLPRIRIHDLRHSHASMLIHMGVPVTAISKRLGHKNPSITLRIYSHLYPGQAEDVVSQIGKLFEDPEGVSDADKTDKS